MWIVNSLYSGSNGEDASRRREQGFDMISVITDVGVLAEGMLREIGVAKGQTQENKPREGY